MSKACSNDQQQYFACLNKNGNNSSKCTALENTLRGCGRTNDVNVCADETVRLMNCSRRSGRDVCKNEFIAMRECNRPSGPEILVEGDNLVVDRPKASMYHSTEIAPVKAPQRLKASSMEEKTDAMRLSIGLATEKDRFKPKLSSTSYHA